MSLVKESGRMFVPIVLYVFLFHPLFSAWFVIDSVLMDLRILGVDQDTR